MDRKKLAAGAAVAAVLTLGAGTAVFAQGGAPADGEGEGRDSDESLTGSSARRAADAALGVARGTVLEVERGDDPGAAYEVEVRKADGSVAEVLLDGDYKVIDQEAGD